MKVIKFISVIAVLVLFALMIPVSIDICSGHVAAKRGFTLLIIYGLLAISVTVLIENAPKVVRHLKRAIKKLSI